jgi:hypothetical protein
MRKIKSALAALAYAGALAGRLRRYGSALGWRCSRKLARLPNCRRAKR